MFPGSDYFQPTAREWAREKGRENRERASGLRGDGILETFVSLLPTSGTIRVCLFLSCQRGFWHFLYSAIKCPLFQMSPHGPQITQLSGTHTHPPSVHTTQTHTHTGISKMIQCFCITYLSNWSWDLSASFSIYCWQTTAHVRCWMWPSESLWSFW